MPSIASRIRTERTKLLRFLVTGVVGALLNIALFDAAYRGLGVDYRLAVVLAFAFSYAFTFVAHRTWTFEATDGHAGHQGARFVAVSAFSTGWAVLVTVIAVEAFGLSENPSEAGAALLTAPVAFVLHRRYTFVEDASSGELPSSVEGIAR